MRRSLRLWLLRLLLAAACFAPTFSYPVGWCRSDGRLTATCGTGRVFISGSVSPLFWCDVARRGGCYGGLTDWSSPFFKPTLGFHGFWNWPQRIKNAPQWFALTVPNWAPISVVLLVLAVREHRRRCRVGVC